MKNWQLQRTARLLEWTTLQNHRKFQFHKSTGKEQTQMDAENPNSQKETSLSQQLKKKRKESDDETKRARDFTRDEWRPGPVFRNWGRKWPITTGSRVIRGVLKKGSQNLTRQQQQLRSQTHWHSLAIHEHYYLQRWWSLFSAVVRLLVSVAVVCCCVRSHVFRSAIQWSSGLAMCAGHWKVCGVWHVLWIS